MNSHIPANSIAIHLGQKSEHTLEQLKENLFSVKSEHIPTTEKVFRRLQVFGLATMILFIILVVSNAETFLQHVMVYISIYAAKYFHKLRYGHGDLHKDFLGAL